MKLFKQYKRSLNKAISFAKHPIIVCLFFLIFLVLINSFFKIDTKNSIFVIAALTTGWVVAFYTTYWNQNKNLINNLKYEAAKSIVQNLSKLSSDLIKLKSFPDNLLTKIELIKDPTGKLFNQWEGIKEQTKIKFDIYSDRFLDVLGGYEENEILFLELRKIMDVFSKKHGDLSNFYYKFHRTLSTMVLMHSEIPNNKEYTQKLKGESSEFSSLCLDMVCYCRDLRVELLNRTLGSIVNKHVEHRKPSDPNCKILSELVD